MTRVSYKVGRDGYYTRCTTLESAKAQQALDPKYTIETVYEDVEEVRAPLSAKRLAWLKSH